MTNIDRIITLLCGATLVASCVETKQPPNPTEQAEVPYGPRLFLADHTIVQEGTSPPTTCRLIGDIETTATATTVGGEELEDPAHPHNCYVDVIEGTLLVDRLEVTNNLFQLCVDSGYCENPDPSTQEKDQICSDGTAFDDCPVVNVPQFEARRFCEFVGRRLPTGIEHIAMRQQNKPQTPGEVQAFPNGDTNPTCNQATLAGCNGPTPSKPGTPGDDNDAEGGAVGDRTDQGIFDLTGNATEWAADLIHERSDELPWFCERPLPTVAPGEAPRCPGPMAGFPAPPCIMGRYDPDGDGALPAADYPVCVASRKLAVTNGTVGMVMGGDFKNTDNTPPQSGLFTRRVVNDPNGMPKATRGFRCVGLAGNPEANRILPVPGTGTNPPDGGVDPMDAPGALDQGVMAMDAGTSSTADAGATMDAGTSSTADGG